MTDSLSRRAALKTLVSATGALGAMAVLPVDRAAAAAAATATATDNKPAAAAGSKPHLTTQDPTAVALAYTEDAGKVDAGKFPTYKPGQHCGNCLQSKGDPKGEWLECNLFPGKMVATKGWCKVYVKRP